MEVSFTRTFERELKKVKEKSIKHDILGVFENVKAAKTVTDIDNIKKLRGSKNAYRIRVGDYRIGIFVDVDNVEFHRIKKRKDIYKYFPLFILP